MPGYDLSQDLGDHEVTIEAIKLIEPEPGKIVVSISVRFENGEPGLKDLYPLASEKSLQITRKTLRAMGFDMDARDLREVDSIKGVKVIAVVEEHEWNGQVRNRISWLNAIRKPANGDSIKKLQAKLRSVKNANAEEELG